MPSNERKRYPYSERDNSLKWRNFPAPKKDSSKRNIEGVEIKIEYDSNTRRLTVMIPSDNPSNDPEHEILTSVQIDGTLDAAGENFLRWALDRKNLDVVTRNAIIEYLKDPENISALANSLVASR